MRKPSRSISSKKLPLTFLLLLRVFTPWVTHTRALAIREKLFGNTHADVAQSLNSLGCLTQDTGRYKESEDFFLRAVSMRETLCGPNHPGTPLHPFSLLFSNTHEIDVAMSLNNLAGLYMDQSRYEDARPVYNRALEIYEVF